MYFNLDQGSGGIKKFVSFGIGKFVSFGLGNLCHFSQF